MLEFMNRFFVTWKTLDLSSAQNYTVKLLFSKSIYFKEFCNLQQTELSVNLY